MLNAIWIAMMVGAVIIGALQGQLDAVVKASTDAATAGVQLAIGLIGVMAFWLGLMRILHEGGLLAVMARGLQPVMKRLFPDVPADSPAMSMMILNMTSNMLGLGNAATPFGLKAMMELDKLNAHKGVASNSMALFLAINTSSLALFPTGIIATRAALGSNNPGSILLPTLIATTASTLVAVASSLLLSRLAVFKVRPGDGGVQNTREVADIDTSMAEQTVAATLPPPSKSRVAAALGLAIAVLGALGVAMTEKLQNATDMGRAVMDTASSWLLVVLIVAIVLYGFGRGVKVYDAVVEGGKEGFAAATKIIPFLVAILVAVGMLRAAGGIEMIVTWLEPFTRRIGMPAEALPMALLRPLSGSGAYAIAADIMKTHGADSLVGQIVSTMQGSTETTFYVLALYFGVVSVRNGRHTLAACLLADTTGALVSAWACLWLLA